MPETEVWGTLRFTPLSPGEEKSANPEVSAPAGCGRELSMGWFTAVRTGGAGRIARRSEAARNSGGAAVLPAEGSSSKTRRVLHPL
jgi:hypothetical protein